MLIILSSLLAMAVALVLFFMGHDWMGAGVLAVHAVISLRALTWRKDRFAVTDSFEEGSE